MNDTEQLTITLPAKMADAIRNAVDAGEFASNSELIVEALYHWQELSHNPSFTIDDMRAFISEGLQDIETGKVFDFNAKTIQQIGRERLTKSVLLK